MAQGCMQFDTVGVDRSLIESTIIAAVLQMLDDHYKPFRIHTHICVWSDSLNAVSQHAHGRLSHKLGHIGDRLVHRVQQCATVLIQWGWVPAQHDTKCQDIISYYNNQVDEHSKWAATNEAAPLWRLP